MSYSEMNELADKFITESGIPIENFYIEVTPFSEMLCYKSEEGREFDLPISDELLSKAVKKRLRELGTKVIELK
jgi:hypothetical protein